MPTSALATIARVTVRLRNRSIGMIGSGCRRSTRTAATSATTAAPTSRKLQPDAHSNLFPANDDQTSKVLTPAVIRNAPHQSIFTSRRTVGSFRVRCSSTIAASTNGTPTRKQARQPSGESTRNPPSSGPPTVAEAKIAPKIPEYRPSSRGGMIAAITIWTSAVRPPAPRPCRTRLPSSTSMFGARPATIEPTTKNPSESWTSSLLL